MVLVASIPKQEVRENYKTRNFIICTLRGMSVVFKNQRGWDGRECNIQGRDE
jgi:hypothetical protein